MQRSVHSNSLLALLQAKCLFLSQVTFIGLSGSTSVIFAISQE